MTKKVKKNKKNIHRLIACAAIVMFVFEQSPANEAVRALLGFSVLSQTGNPLLVGVAVAVVTLCIEFVSSLLITLGLVWSRHFSWLAKKMSSNKGASDRTHKSGIADYVLAIGIGAGAMVVKKQLMNEHQSIQDGIKYGFKAALVIAIFSGFIGYLASGGVELARRYGLGSAAETFLEVATDWRFWLLFIVVAQLSQYLINKYKTLDNA